VSTGAGSACGVVRQVAALADVQGQAFAAPTVLLAERVSGNEDIPQNVVVSACAGSDV
jgi:hypothetical protein